MKLGKRAVTVGAVAVLALAGIAGAVAIPRALAQKARPPERTVAPAPTGAPPAPPVESAAPHPAESAAPSARASATPAELPPVRRLTSWRSDTNFPQAKLDETRARKLDVVRGLFAEAKVTFPPAQMLLRAFKKEMRLEMWAASAAGTALTHVTTHEICAASGGLGPKRKQGDLQVPEGFYTLTDYNSASKYYLSLLVSYPNQSDRILGDKADPGSAIMIHGRCHSKGCLSMSDEGIQEIWVAATELRTAGGTVAVHIFPGRDMAALVREATDPALRAFWENLAEGLDRFENGHKLPAIEIDAQGRYLFR